MTFTVNFAALEQLLWTLYFPECFQMFSQEGKRGLCLTFSLHLYSRFNTRKTWHSPVILLRWKNSREHFVFQNVFRCFPKRVNAVFVSRFFYIYIHDKHKENVTFAGNFAALEKLPWTLCFPECFQIFSQDSKRDVCLTFSLHLYSR